MDGPAGNAGDGEAARVRAVERRQRSLTIVAAAALIVALAALALGAYALHRARQPHGSTEQPAVTDLFTTVTSTSSVASKLAAIDAGSDVVEADTIAEYETVLRALEANCRRAGDSRLDGAGIGDLAIVALERHTTLGADTTILEILKGLDRVITQPPPDESVTCALLARTLIVTRERWER